MDIKNNSNSGNDRDKFTYTITITPDDRTSIHTIVIGQASYAEGGNSEVARQTLSFTENTQINIPVQATVRENPKVNYFFGAMGDYFMGEKLAGNSFSSNNPTNQPQLRVDSFSGGNNNLYYYNLTALNGTGNSSSFTPTTNGNGYVSFASGRKRGILPDTPTFKNILKESSTNPNNQNSYSALNTSTVIPNNGRYVSYGVENITSNYVIAVRNAESVTLTYEGIMQGNSALEADVVGETYNEWISFGVESEPLYVFSGKVFNDNGGIENADPQDISIVNNTNYFNGKLDNNEVGISASNLQVRLTDCNNNNIVTVPGTPNPQTVANTNQDRGKYSFSVLPTTLANNTTEICVVEEEPLTSSWIYTVDTTPNKLNTNFTTSTYKYTDLNFGEVTQNNSALALKKYQFVHKCDTTLPYKSIDPDTSSPLTGFSTKEIRDIDPGMCIAYKIEAYNRGHVSLASIQIIDTLQKASTNPTKVESVFYSPVPGGIPATLHEGDKPSSPPTTLGKNGTIISDKFNLTNTTSSTSIPMEVLYFNTKYGTTTTP
ncbi:hypothetical protein QL919_05855 [Psychrobacter sp. APC 3426]|uniref:hypothetical protein n=1 Tax=Psychrobacter sp. APC 3426 TaxID=3035177 RepID=UPI0025B297AB|nr:hypothetical protein [Psychrobacter sp. APC 3426]MDN3398249.1 hypothetical protein [Psychrobacter sp. APC 3426]